MVLEEICSSLLHRFENSSALLTYNAMNVAELRKERYCNCVTQLPREPLRLLLTFSYRLSTMHWRSVVAQSNCGSSIDKA